MDTGPDKYLEEKCRAYNGLLPPDRSLIELAQKIREAIGDKDADKLNKGAVTSIENYPAEFLSVQIAVAALSPIDDLSISQIMDHVKKQKSLVERMIDGKKAEIEYLEEPVSRPWEADQLARQEEIVNKLKMDISRLKDWRASFDCRDNDSWKSLINNDPTRLGYICQAAQRWARIVKERSQGRDEPLSLPLCSGRYAKKPGILERAVLAALGDKYDDWNASKYGAEVRSRLNSLAGTSPLAWG